MRRLAILSAVFVLAGCASRGPATTSAPGHGAISVSLVPNPIVAKLVAPSTYEFPVEIVLRETGGHPVSITRVTLDVYALGGAIHAGSETYDAVRIAREGFATTVPANGEVRYRMKQRKSVPDERLFSGVTGVLQVEGVDDTNTPATARVTTTVTR